MSGNYRTCTNSPNCAQCCCMMGGRWVSGNEWDDLRTGQAAMLTTTFLEAAKRVLMEEGVPLSALEIARIAVERELLKTSGDTPANTMGARLSEDVLIRGQFSEFMRIAPGKFALRSWAHKLDEYQAPRFQRKPSSEYVVVIPRNQLAALPQGDRLLATAISGDFLSSNWSRMEREKAELDTSVVQLVSVFLITHDNQCLTYRRTRRLPEQRLHGCRSVLFGGHLVPEDMPSLLSIFVPDQAQPFVLRELFEELSFPESGIPPMRYLGLIYDQTTEVSRQHLGLAYEVLPPSPRFAILEPGSLADAKYESVEMILSRLSDFENWSALLLQHLAKPSIELKLRG